MKSIRRRVPAEVVKRLKKRKHPVMLTIGTTFTLLAIAGIITSIPDIIRYYRIKTM